MASTSKPFRPVVIQFEWRYVHMSLVRIDTSYQPLSFLAHIAPTPAPPDQTPPPDGTCTGRRRPPQGTTRRDEMHVDCAQREYEHGDPEHRQDHNSNGTRNHAPMNLSTKH